MKGGHIKEHLEGKVDPTAHMTPEQLQFHYFNMHDLDKNGRLDGVELIKAITHFHQENPGPQHQGTNTPPPLPSEVELEQMIDSILKEDDFNADGFIDYGEFLRAQKQREEQARAHHQQQQQQQQPPQQQQQQPPQQQHPPPPQPQH
ncbi:Protein F55A11.1 [Aphelenchoides avenae]|nr:Protein F55A11.1 [Aphelenchus avenae]